MPWNLRNIEACEVTYLQPYRTHDEPKPRFLNHDFGSEEGIRIYEKFNHHHEASHRLWTCACVYAVDYCAVSDQHQYNGQSNHIIWE